MRNFYTLNTRLRQLVIGFLTVILANAITLNVHGQGVYANRALFLYNFTRYLEWPSANGNICIGVLGDEQAAKEIKRVFSGKNTLYRRYIVRHYAQPKDIRDCQVLFMADTALNTPEAADRIFADVMKKIRQQPVVIVSESPDAIRRGSCINFMLIHRKLNFEVNSQRLRRLGIKVSDRLLRMAVTI
jgi:hypothetical protein